MGSASARRETALPALGAVIVTAAEFAEQAAGSGLESAALALYGTLLSVAGEVADFLGSAGAAGTEATAVAAAMLYSGIQQGRAVLASRETGAEALAEARQRGREEERERHRARTAAARQAVPRQLRHAAPPLKVISA